MLIKCGSPLNSAKKNRLVMSIVIVRLSQFWNVYRETVIVRRFNLVCLWLVVKTKKVWTKTGEITDKVSMPVCWYVIPLSPEEVFKAVVVHRNRFILNWVTFHFIFLHVDWQLLQWFCKLYSCSTALSVNWEFNPTKILT